MPSPNPPQRLQDLDRSSPEFPSRLTDTLLGEGSVNRAQNIPDEELGPFIEYLDIVRLRVAFASPLLNTFAGPQ